MKLTLLPKTRAGIWSVALGVLSLLILATLFVLSNFTKVLTSEDWIAIIALSADAVATGALVAGAVATIKFKERSAIVFLAIAGGMLGFMSALIGVIMSFTMSELFSNL